MLSIPVYMDICIASKKRKAWSGKSYECYTFPHDLRRIFGKRDVQSHLSDFDDQCLISPIGLWRPMSNLTLRILMTNVRSHPSDFDAWPWISPNGLWWPISNLTHRTLTIDLRYDPSNSDEQSGIKHSDEIQCFGNEFRSQTKSRPSRDAKQNLWILTQNPRISLMFRILTGLLDFGSVDSICATMCYLQFSSISMFRLRVRYWYIIKSEYSQRRIPGGIRQESLYIIYIL